jgi:type VI secretion system secreted protein VgrG
LGSHSLILADDIGSHSFLLNGPTVIPYYPSNRAAVVHDEDYISNWASHQIIVSGSYEANDYDPEKSRVPLRSSEFQRAGHLHDSKDVYQWPGGYIEHGDGDNYAKVRMTQVAAACQAVIGGGSLRNIAPGYFFKFDRYPVDTYNQQYLIEWAKYEFTENIERSDGGGIDTPTTYYIHFTAVPSNVRYRALRPIHKPLTHGPQTAVVTGPPGEEIWTDKYGRVKVQFHWDRYGTNDENSSCWIRVSQVWAGTNYGVIHTPRVGQEVIVDFLNGDPDYPIITGRVYNDMQMPPWELPKYKTESGIQTLSSKGGGGKHMLRFEDQKGIEHINLGTDYGETHLLMGYLLNQVNNVQRSYGFELRTNDWGAIRAKKGLLLTTYDQNRREHITHNNPEGYTQLGANLEAAQALMEQAKEAVTSMAAAISNLTELKNSNMIQMSADIESMVGMAAATTSLNQVAAAIKDFAASGNETGAQPEQQMPTNTDPAMKQAVDMHAKSKDINQPIVSIVSPEGQSIISPKPVVVSSGQSVSMHGTGAVTVSTQDQLTQLVKNGMLTHISSGGQRTTVTSGDVAHEAQSGHMNLVAQQNITMGSTDADASLLAKQNINVSATEDSVLIKAGKHIRLEAGSSITLVVGDKAFVQLTNDGNIIVCGKAKGVLQFDDELDQFGKSINLNCDETT